MIVALVRCYTGVSFLVISFLFTSYIRDAVSEVIDPVPISLHIVRILIVLLLGLVVYHTSKNAFAFNNFGHYENKKMQLSSFVEMTMEKITIPFSLRLDPNFSCSYDGVNMRICSKEGYRLLSFWGVSIDGLRANLRQPWDALSEQIYCNTFLLGHYHRKSEESIHSVLGEETVEVRIPYKEDPLPDMKCDPRVFYPLVVVIVKLDENWFDSGVNLHVSVIHIKDSYFHQPSRILYQYIKLADGRLLELKQLYFISPDHPEEEADGLCAVCQSRPLRCALLPCRHTCICLHCLSKLKSCPLCRGRIESYFFVNEDELSLTSEEDCSSTSFPQQSTTSEILTIDSWNYRQ